MSFDEFCMVLCVISLVSVWLGGYAPAFSWKMGIGAACWTLMSGMGSITMRRRLVQSRLVKKARLLCRKTVPAFNTHTLQWLLAAWPGFSAGNFLLDWLAVSPPAAWSELFGQVAGSRRPRPLPQGVQEGHHQVLGRRGCASKRGLPPILA